MAVNWKEIDRIAQAHLKIDPLASELSLLRQLRLWWCIRYERPLKDPLLDTYSLDELVYEYLLFHYLDPENDPEEKKRREETASSDEAWAREMLSQAHKPKENKDSEKAPEPTPTIPDLPDISTQFKE